MNGCKNEIKNSKKRPKIKVRLFEHCICVVNDTSSNPVTRSITKDLFPDINMEGDLFFAEKHIGKLI